MTTMVVVGGVFVGVCSRDLSLDGEMGVGCGEREGWHAAQMSFFFWKKVRR